MKQHIPWIATMAIAALIAVKLVRPPSPDEAMLRDFGRLPVLLNGRIKPMDTVARNSLLVMQNRQRVVTTAGDNVPPQQWLLDVFFRPSLADTYPTFRIDSPEVLDLLGITEDERRIQYDSPTKRMMASLGALPSSRSRFSYEQIQPHLAEVDRQARLADPVKPEQRSRFQRHILRLYQQLITYQKLQNSLEDARSLDFAQDLQHFEHVVGPGMAAVQRQDQGLEYDEQAMNELLSLGVRFQQLSAFAHIRVVPPRNPAAVADPTNWMNIGESLLESMRDGWVHPVVQAYAEMGTAYRAGDMAAFRTTVDRISRWMTNDYQADLGTASHEAFFNRFAPFYIAMSLYVAVFILACSSWIAKSVMLRQTAFALTGLAFLIHTSGVVMRIFIQGYAPVTNLYSSAVVVGWAAILLGLILERIFRNGVGSVVSGVIGFCTLLIAHHLSLSGDTMEMMQAVLDDNFWLSTHVMAIVIGYSATFLAGALAITYIVLGVGTTLLKRDASSIATDAETAKPLRETNAKALYRMVYGIICFATLCSFVGTVLGGIWADQSWGRFWGWDPKENGAALIVLWNAIILHARWGGFVRERGVMVMAVFGNIVTAWSWFGVNLLNVGLHSYGFTESGAFWLGLFWASQAAIMAVGLTPLHMWRSFSDARREGSLPPPRGGHPSPASGTAGR